MIVKNYTKEYALNLIKYKKRWPPLENEFPTGGRNEDGSPETKSYYDMLNVYGKDKRDEVSKNIENAISTVFMEYIIKKLKEEK